ncbi:dTDP-4-dehydrorhamnose 3,5-epimerase [Dokdonia sp. Hel_I_53]|uniref:dTDP-4-dehydrorhamnose 3,5-epimerase n=1 Tax=Dokdonia sp. Hel_I_53 TaxID=1566287 RepID=UPI0011996FFA|nr:dTDP-4-dehydrorhamnose 3,5-epimerase [Dokdonia sp. Hel_I_53]TVZ51330.1 dTDP-4-dehydrorhamnose 3,5-epimerase [Dokdonia sp. Hel_I_53]
MQYQKTNFKDLIICSPTVHSDERGYFYESFHLKSFQDFTGLSPQFVQDNQSRSGFGALRGLHFQTGKDAQSKLVRVLEGEVLDVVVDLRKEEATFGKTFSIQLSAQNRKQLFIPKGMAHGFITLTEYATFAYKCDAYYNSKSEGGIAYNDTTLCIDWMLPSSNFIISEKDQKNHPFKDLPKDYLF